MKLSIIIPTLNEAHQLPALLDDIRAQQGMDCEIVVVDAGSEDGTAALARKAGARVLFTEAGRARQMNCGARHARHSTLLFVHADSRIFDACGLSDALRFFQQEAQRDRNIAGHFTLTFRDYSPTHASFYRYLERKSALNRPWTFNGDQGLLIEREFFDLLGGFDERLSFLEDQRIGQKIRQQGAWKTLPGTISTSARRFEKEGTLERYLLMAVTMGAFASDTETFFEELPQIYPAQCRTGTLDVSDFLRRLRGVLRKMGMRRSLRAFNDVGRFVRQNAWQLFFAFDTYWDRETLPIYDKLIASRLDHPFFDLLAGLLTYTVIFGVLPPLFRDEMN